MKKLILVMLLVCIAPFIRAESYIGGTLGYGLTRVSSETANVFIFAPEGGHRLNDVWSLGASVALKYQDVWGDGITNLALLPYVRATFAHAGIIDFFGEIAAGYGCYVSDGYYDNSFVCALRPGFLINTSKRFALLCRTTLLSYELIDEDSAVGFSINSNLELGFMFKF